MSLAQGFPNTFSGQVTNQVTKRHESEFQKIYSDVNNIMAANGHAHTGSGSDGAKIDYSNILNTPAIPTTSDMLNPTGATHYLNPVVITSASGVVTLLETSNSFIVNGTEDITSITGWTKGIAIIRWNTVRKLTYNATSFIMQNDVDRITNVGDIGVYEITSAGVREISYQPAIFIFSPGVQGTFKNLKITNNNVISFTGNTTISTTGVASVSSTAGLVVGMQVFGAGIQTGTTIAVIGTGTITLSVNATATATGVALTAGYSNTRTDITADQIVLFNTSNYGYLATNVSLTADLSVSGANGLDTGTKANSTWYSVWVIAKLDGTKACLLSLSATAPTMPTGYIYKARIGWVRTDANGNLLRILQVGRHAQYIVDGITITAPVTMQSGTVGAITATATTWSAISISTFVPSTAPIIKVMVSNAGSNVIMISPNNLYVGGFNGKSAPLMIDAIAGVGVTMTQSMLLESSNIYVASTDSTTAVQCVGWEDSI